LRGSADEECELSLFESGATVIDIAAHHPGLLPGDANARAHAIRWLFAALNTVEPPIKDEASQLEERLRKRTSKGVFHKRFSTRSMITD